MPRFLGQDYYTVDNIARRELSSRTSLIVPHHFNEDTNDNQTYSTSVIHGLFKDFHNELQPFEDFSHDGNLPVILEVETGSKYGCEMETLEWDKRWKAFNGHYIEIVPSSNPDSDDSICESQSDSQNEVCDVEDFCITLQETYSKDNKLLEEPVSTCQSSVSSVLGSLLKSSIERFLPCLSYIQHLPTECDAGLSDITVFGKADLEFAESEMERKVLHTSFLSHTTDDVEKFYLHCFKQTKAEELMYAVNIHDSPPHSQAENGIISEASSVCKGLQNFPQLSPSVHLDKTSDETALKDEETTLKDVMDLCQPREQAIEYLVMSPIKQCQLSTFLCLNEKSDTDDPRRQKTSKAKLESPLYMDITSSPSLRIYHEYIQDACTFQLWSPERLLHQSPFLSTQDAKKLEGSVRYTEACFGGLQAMKFPELCDEIRNQDDKPDHVAIAFQEASSVDCGTKLGQLELDLTWDITSAASLPISLVCNETLTLDHTSLPPPWKLSLSFDIVEDMVTQTADKKSFSLMVDETDSTKSPKNLCPENSIRSVYDDGSATSVTNRRFTLIEKDSGTNVNNEHYTYIEKTSSGRNLKNNHFSAIEKSGSAANPNDEYFSSLKKTATSFSESDSSTINTKNNINNQLCPLSLPLCDNSSNHPISKAYFLEHMSGQKAVPNFTKNVVQNNCSQRPLTYAKSSDQSAEMSVKRKIDILENPTVQTVLNEESEKFVSHSIGLDFKDKKKLDISETPSGQLCLNERFGKKHLSQSALQDPGVREDNVQFATCCEPVQIESGREGKTSHLRTISCEENSVQGDFDLHFDESDMDLGSDSFEEIQAPEKSYREKAQSSSICQSFDPVDNFLMLRDVQPKSHVVDLPKGHSIVRPVQKTESRDRGHPGVITPMSIVPRSVSDSEQRFVTVSLSGQFLKALQEICSQAESHIHLLKTEGIMPQNAKFMSLRIDYTRFLLKDRAANLETSCLENGEDEMYKSMAMVHTLRCAADILERSCLECAIVHLGAMQNKHATLTGALERLRKTLFQYQFMMQQTRQLHPKVAAVCRELQQHKQSIPAPYRVLVKVQHDQPVLLKTLQSAISMDGTTIETLSAIHKHKCWPENIECVLTWNQTTTDTLLPIASLLIEFEADKDSTLCKTCQAENAHYIGLICLSLGQDSSETSADRDVLSDDNGVTIVGSQNLIKNQQLLQLLETRHNIIVLRRDFISAGQVHHPDAVVNMHKGAVLLDARQLKEEGELERQIERLMAVGLQLTTVWILLHSLGDTTRNPFSGDVVKKMAQLQALLANLSTAAKGFITMYKVFLCKTAGDIAQYIYYLAVSANSFCLQDKHVGAENVSIPVEMSKEEKFLLGIPCLNPFSCHLLLSRGRLGELLSMSCERLCSLVPELPDCVVQNLNHVITMDRGLQLRPQVIGFYPSHTLSQNNQCQAEGQINSSQEPEFQNHTVSEMSVSDHATPHNFASENFPAAGSHHQKEGCPAKSLCVENGDTESISPEVKNQSMSLALFKDLHYSDQPTPFLLPPQQPQEQYGWLQGHIDTRKTEEDKEKVENYGSSALCLKMHGIVGPEHFPFQRQSCNRRYQAENHGKSYRQIMDKGLDHHNADFASPFSHNKTDVTSNQESEFIHHSNSGNLLPESSLLSFSNSYYQPQLDSVFSSGHAVEAIKHVDSAYGGHCQLLQDAKLMMSKEGRSRKTQLDVSCSGYGKSVLSYAQMVPQTSNDKLQKIYSTKSLSDECWHSDFNDGRRHEEMWNNSGRLPDNSFAHCFDAVPGCSRLGLRPTEMKNMPVGLPLDMRQSLSSGLSFMSKGKSQLIERDTTKGCETFHDQKHTISDKLRPSEHPPHTRMVGYSSNDTYLKEFGNQKNQTSSLAEDLDFRKHIGLAPFTNDYFGQPVSVLTNTYIQEKIPYLKQPVQEPSSHYRLSQESDFFEPMAKSPGFVRSHDHKWADTRQVSEVTLSSHSQSSFNENLAAATRRLLEGKSPEYLCSGHRNYYKPRSLGHRVSIGLAQPLRRKDTNSQDSGKSEEHLSNKQSSKPSDQHCALLSPPLDTDSFDDMKQHHRISETKLKKWSHRLQFRQNQTIDSHSDGYDEDGQCPCPKKKRAVEPGRLTYRSIPGTGGQTKLTFL